MAKEKEQRLTVVVSDELHRKAKIKAAKTGKPMAEVMREALKKWAENEDDPPG